MGGVAATKDACGDMDGDGGALFRPGDASLRRRCKSATCAAWYAPSLSIDFRSLLFASFSAAMASECCSLSVLRSVVKLTYSTASARLMAKNEPMMIITTKYHELHSLTASWVQYMMSTHPSRLMHWKIASHAPRMLSKLVMSWFGASYAMHHCPSGQEYPLGFSPFEGYFATRGPPHVVSSCTVHLGAAGNAQSLAHPDAICDALYPAYPTSYPHRWQPAFGLSSDAHRRFNAPLNSCTPINPSKKNKNAMSTATSPSNGSEFSRVTTS